MRSAVDCSQGGEVEELVLCLLQMPFSFYAISFRFIGHSDFTDFKSTVEIKLSASKMLGSRVSYCLS